MTTRRQFTQLAVGALAGAPAILGAGAKKSRVNGVMIGAQSYSFRDRPLDAALDAMREIGLTYMEMWQGHIEPRGLKPDELKQWRTDPKTLLLLKETRAKIKAKGVVLSAFNYSFRKNQSDEELDFGMKMAKALGTKFITASSQVSNAARINGFARKNGVVVAMHGHSNLKDPDEFSTAATFEKAMEGNSNIMVNLDLGHFVASNEDPVAYMEKRHARIVTLHVKDRKKNNGANVPFGQGDTPIKQCLQLLKTNKWKIPAMIEYEYKGADTLAEVKKCFDYCRQCLA